MYVVAIFFAIVWMILPIWVGQKIGGPKGRAGWAWGLVLGWLGVVVVALLSDKNPQRRTSIDLQTELAGLEAEARLFKEAVSQPRRQSLR
jgi:hypothetical protein